MQKNAVTATILMIVATACTAMSAATAVYGIRSSVDAGAIAMVIIAAIAIDISSAILAAAELHRA